jgi:hypothetical protein
MSKVVKSIGRAIGKVVKGVTKVVKKVAKSKFGKVLVAAAAIYFGGAALMGGLSAPAGSGLSGFMSGAGSGISNAWSSLLSAGSSAMSGNFAQAGSQLASGFQGGTAASTGAQTFAPSGIDFLTGNNAAVASQSLGAMPSTSPYINPATGANPLAPLVQAPPAPPSSGFWSSYGGAGAMIAGSQLAGGLISGVGQSKAQQEQRAYEERTAADARDRYNANFGSSLWGSPVEEDPSYGYGAGVSSTLPPAPPSTQPRPLALLPQRGLIGRRYYN